VMGDVVQVDGVYGPRTEAAVRSFMSQQGLEQQMQMQELLPAAGQAAGQATEEAAVMSGGVAEAAAAQAAAIDRASAVAVVSGGTDLSAASAEVGGESGGEIGGESESGGGGDASQTKRTKNGGGRMGAEKKLSGQRSQLSPLGESLLQELYLSELEARALHAASTSAATTPYTVDEDIKMLQLYLNETMGRELVKPDGVFGPRTVQAVRDFQTRYGMPLGGDVAEQLRTVSSVLRKARAGAAAEDSQGKLPRMSDAR